MYFLLQSSLTSLEKFVSVSEHLNNQVRLFSNVTVPRNLLSKYPVGIINGNDGEKQENKLKVQ